jgi:hypothetical protein
MELIDKQKIEILTGIVARLSNLLYNKVGSAQDYDKDFSILDVITRDLRDGTLTLEQWEEYIR